MSNTIDRVDALVGAICGFSIVGLYATAAAIWRTIRTGQAATYRLRITDANGHLIRSVSLSSAGVFRLLDACDRGQFD